MSLKDVLEKLAVIAPEIVVDEAHGIFAMCLCGETGYYKLTSRNDVAAITHLMFSEMREAWKVEPFHTSLLLSNRVAPLKALNKIFHDEVDDVNECPYLTDELIHETYLKWVEARKESQ